MQMQCQSRLFMHNSNQNRILHTPRQRTIYNFQTLHGEYSMPHWFNPQPSSRQVSRFHDREISVYIERRKLVSSWLRTHRPRLRSISEGVKKLKKIQSPLTCAISLKCSNESRFVSNRSRLNLLKLPWTGIGFTGSIHGILHQTGLALDFG